MVGMMRPPKCIQNGQKCVHGMTGAEEMERKMLIVSPMALITNKKHTCQQKLKKSAASSSSDVMTVWLASFPFVLSFT